MALAFGLGGLLALIAAAQLTEGIPSALRAAVLRTSFSGAALTGGAVGVVLCISMPSRSALQNLLDLLPVGRLPSRLGQIAPLYAVALLYSLALSATGAAVVVRTATSTWASAGGIASYAALVVVALSCSIALFTITQSTLGRLLHIPPHYAAAAGGLVSLVATIAATVPDILASQPQLHFTWSLSEVLPARVFAWAALGSPWALAGSGSWLLGTVALLWFAARLRPPSLHSRQPRWLQGMPPIRRTAWWGQVWCESLTSVRNPQYAMTALLVAAAVIAVKALALLPAVNGLSAQLALSVAVFPFMLALYSAGRTRPSSWIARSSGADRASATMAKPTAIAVTSGIPSVAALIALLVLDLVSLHDLPEAAARCAFALALALSVGVVIPYSEQQPLSVIAGGFVLGIVYLLVTLGIGLVTQSLAMGTSTLAMCAAALAAFAVYLSLDTRAQRAEPVRA